MRFSRLPVYEFKDTNRKRLAYARKQRLELETLPLFADKIAGEQIDVDLEMAQRRLNWERHEREDRKRRASDWRRARARLNAFPNRERGRLYAYWQRCPFPADPSYLLSMLHMYENGRLEMDPPTVTMTEANRLAVKLTIERLLGKNSERDDIAATVVGR